MKFLANIALKNSLDNALNNALNNALKTALKIAMIIAIENMYLENCFEKALSSWSWIFKNLVLLRVVCLQL